MKKTTVINLAIVILGSLGTAAAVAGGPPVEPVQVPIMTDLGLIGISLVVACYAGRAIARRFR